MDRRFDSHGPDFRPTILGAKPNFGGQQFKG